jgi:hypothetical protein
VDLVFDLLGKFTVFCHHSICIPQGLEWNMLVQFTNLICSFHTCIFLCLAFPPYIFAVKEYGDIYGVWIFLAPATHILFFFQNFESGILKF